MVPDIATGVKATARKLALLRQAGQVAARSPGSDIEAALADWSLAPLVRALQALRGMAMVVVAALISELGDITRFANPRQLSYLGPHDSPHKSTADPDVQISRIKMWCTTF